LVDEATTTATVAGSSPEGVNFTVRFYRSTSAANAAVVRANRRYTARFGRVVVNFAGNPSPRPGQAPRVLKHIDLVTIRHCVLRLSSVPPEAGETVRARGAARFRTGSDPGGSSPKDPSQVPRTSGA